MTTPADSLKQRMQQTWAAGDFSKVGVASVIVGELLCEFVELRAGERVLDVATGAGSTAISAARRGTEVTGVDFVPSLLDRARERAQAEGLPQVVFQEADTEALPFADGSFDVVLSTFGHMFAPDPAKATSEMVRVIRRGGRIGFTAWTPTGFAGAMFKVNAKYNPPQPGMTPPVAWGDENVVRERFFRYAADFRFERCYLNFRALTAEQWLAHMRENFGPTKVLWEKLDDTGRESLTKEMLAMLGEHNQSGDSTLFIPSEYLEARIKLR